MTTKYTPITIKNDVDKRFYIIQAISFHDKFQSKQTCKPAAKLGWYLHRRIKRGKQDFLVC